MLEITGNIDGIRRVHLKELERLDEMKSDTFIAPEILEPVARISAMYRREIMLTLTRGGRLVAVTVGTHAAVGNTVTGKSGVLNGMRSVHTHPSGAARLSEMDVTCLEQLRYDALAAVAIDETGTVTGACVGYLTPRGVTTVASRDLQETELLAAVVACERELRAAKKDSILVKEGAEKAILCAVFTGAEDDMELVELEDLAKTAGAVVVGRVTQNRARAESATMIGAGKLTELAQTVQLTDADTVIFDNELSGVQVKNLEERLGVKVIDRSNLILDIFAARASSTEGKLQVELAQLKYNLPRLIGSHGTMAKMRSGIGMRGPGEKKLETDRRRIRAQISDLERRIEQVQKSRDLRRERRNNGGIKRVALVGYTNAGKSTLMNRLSKSDVYVADQLFATLDPVTRSARTANGYPYLITDTVGFVNKLPHQFIEAFSSTLEEAVYADMLLIVVDGADKDRALKYDVTLDVLKKIGAGNHRYILVYNKLDKTNDLTDLDETAVDTVNVSALTGDGLAALKQMIEETLFPHADGEPYMQY